MPTITFEKKSLFKQLSKKMTDDEMKEKIPMLGTPIEEMDKHELTVEVSPNRPDLLSLQGFARAMSTFLGLSKGLKKYKVKDSGEKVIIDDSVKEVRPYTACAIIKNINFDDDKIKEVIQIQEKLHVTFGRNRKKAAIGIYPMENIKLPITFKALDPKEIKFRPLEANKEMTGLQILSQHPTGREYGHLLDGKDVFPVFVDADGKIMSVPPIINSHETGRITEKTKEVFIECSGFDLKVLKRCLNMLTSAMSEMGGDIYSMELQYEKEKVITPVLEPEGFTINTKYINKLLGLELSDKEFKKNLEKMGFSYEPSKKKVLVPAYRNDIMHDADIAEDIAIAYDFDNFEPEIPNVATIGQEDKFEIFKRQLSHTLIGMGLLETKSYNLTSSTVQKDKMNLEKLDLVKIANALTVDYDVLRAWVIPSCMNTFSNNRNSEYPQKIFDIGTIFKKSDKSSTGVVQNDRLCVALCDKDVSFTSIKQIFDALARSMELDYEIKEDDHPSFISGRVGRIYVKGKGVAYIGEIHPQVLEKFELEMPVAAFELNLSDLYELLY